MKPLFLRAVCEGRGCLTRHKMTNFELFVLSKIPEPAAQIELIRSEKSASIWRIIPVSKTAFPKGDEISFWGQKAYFQVQMAASFRERKFLGCPKNRQRWKRLKGGGSLHYLVIEQHAKHSGYTDHMVQQLRRPQGFLVRRTPKADFSGAHWGSLVSGHAVAMAGDNRGFGELCRVWIFPMPTNVSLGSSGNADCESYSHPSNCPIVQTAERL